MATENLGIIQALIVDATEPTSSNHKKMFWYDSGNYSLKYWDIGLGAWTEVTGHIDKHLYKQENIAKAWTIVHTMNKRPAVTVVDNLGTVIGGEIQHLSDSKFTVSFNVPMQGYVICN